MQFFPKNPKFFEMFDRLADTLHQASIILTKIKISQKNNPNLIDKVRDLELQADTICHHLTLEAESTFITPIDREDISTLAQSLDNIIDYIEDVVSRVVLYNGIGKRIKEYQHFTKIIFKATNLTKVLINLLKYRDKYREKMKKTIIEIQTLENEGDDLVRKAFKSLFTRTRNAVAIIKWKDLYEKMEEVLDECERTSEIVEEIMIKNF